MRPLDLSNLIGRVCFHGSAQINYVSATNEPGGAGHCPVAFSYPAAEALWLLLGALRTSWEPASIDHDQMKHYFLRHRGGSLTLDPALFERDYVLLHELSDLAPFGHVPCGRTYKIVELAGFDWPLESGASVCTVCGGSGENARVFCEGCSRPRLCLACGGSGIQQIRPAILAARY